ncbi:hypothetical protein AB1286_18735 [Trinickia sp. NRRL B-1857]|uniref:hypothetical protein n=1 Tax=Trinickia sp. NRRL B-1857 TaxID=3162879 RepID=UPI003D2ADCA5
MEIASEEEKVRIRLASNDGGACSGDCLTRRKRHDLLEAELDMLMTEEHEAKRREVEDDRQADSSQRLRDSLREDPATARLASLTGADEQTLNMVLALVCAGVLDFTGSFCWYLVLARSRNRAVVKANPEVVLDAPSRRDQTEVDEGATADSSASPIIDAADGRLVQLVHEVAAGNVRPTVDGIREHFNCAQKTANHLRRKYLALCEAIQSTTAQC